MRDDGEERLRARRRPPVRNPWRAALAAGGLLLAAATGCTQRTELRESPATPPPQSAAVSSALNAPPPSQRDEAIGRRSTRSKMLSHYADTAAMHRAVIAGRLADYQAAAAAVARDEWAPSTGAHDREFTERARAAASAARAAPSLVAAALALGTLGDVCASCHLASGVPQLPIAPEEPIEASDPRMRAHAIASDRLWAGLTLPSDESWASGMELLEQDLGLADPSAEVSAAARQLRELARRGKHAEPDQRGRALADVLLTCSGCHERLGVVLEDRGVVR